MIISHKNTTQLTTKQSEFLSGKKMVNPAEREGSTHPLDERVWKRVEEQCSNNLKKDDFLIRDLFESSRYMQEELIWHDFSPGMSYSGSKDLPGCV